MLIFPESTRSASSTLNRYSVLQSSTSQSSPPPAQTSDSDSRRSLGRYSTSEKRWATNTNVEFKCIKVWHLLMSLIVYVSPSRGSTGRERSEKPVSSGPSRPGPFSRGSSAKELTDNVAPQETWREGPDSHHTPRKASISEEKCEMENNRVTETCEEGRMLTLVNTYTLKLHSPHIYLCTKHIYSKNWASVSLQSNLRRRRSLVF